MASKLLCAAVLCLVACARTPVAEPAQTPATAQPLANEPDPKLRTWIRREDVSLCDAFGKKLVDPSAITLGRVLAVEPSRWIMLDPNDKSSNLLFTPVRLSVLSVVQAKAGVEVPGEIVVHFVGTVASGETMQAGDGPLVEAVSKDGMFGVTLGEVDGVQLWFAQSGLYFWQADDKWMSDWQYTDPALALDTNALTGLFGSCGDW